MEQRRESLVTVASFHVFFFFPKNVKAAGELKNIPNTRTLEVYVPVWDKSISRDWYDSCHLEILFLIIGDAVAG